MIRTPFIYLSSMLALIYGYNRIGAALLILFLVSLLHLIYTDSCRAKKQST